MSRGDAYVPIKGAVVAESRSGMAILVRFREVADLFDDGRHDRWVPRSVCEGGQELGVGDDDIRVAEWWLSKEGLLGIEG